MSGVFKNNRHTPVRDTRTGQVYQSKYKAGKALASQFGFNPTDKFVRYKILKKLIPADLWKQRQEKLFNLKVEPLVANR